MSSFYSPSLFAINSFVRKKIHPEYPRVTIPILFLKMLNSDKQKWAQINFCGPLCWWRWVMHSVSGARRPVIFEAFRQWSSLNFPFNSENASRSGKPEGVGRMWNHKTWIWVRALSFTSYLEPVSAELRLHLEFFTSDKRPCRTGGVYGSIYLICPKKATL